MELQNYSSFSPSESEFLAENELVTIVPNMKIDALNFIMGTYGPFLADSPGIVPLWLACMLKESQQARIICPPWMQKIALEETLKEELRHNEKFSSSLPYHYVEIGELLLRYARDDIEQPDKIELLLEEIQTLREGKIQSGGRLILTEAQGQDIVEVVNITNLGAMEANMLREGIVKVMDVLAGFNRAQTARAKTLNKSSSSSSSSGIQARNNLDNTYDDSANTGSTSSGVRDAIRKKLKRSIKSRMGTQSNTTMTTDDNEDNNNNEDDNNYNADNNNNNNTENVQEDDGTNISNREAHQAASISHTDISGTDNNDNSLSLENILTSTTGTTIATTTSTSLHSSSSSDTTTTTDSNTNNNDTNTASRGLRRFRKGGPDDDV